MLQCGSVADRKSYLVWATFSVTVLICPNTIILFYLELYAQLTHLSIKTTETKIVSISLGYENLRAEEDVW